MARTSQSELTLLRWSEHVPASDVQDPLGLSLRGSARLASRLLYCITSITPRARYFSFIPWAVQDWQQKEKGKRFAVGLSEAIALREKALTLGCVVFHDGRPCVGGALVGSDSVATWFKKGKVEVDLRKLPFAKNPALDAYFNSLVNLGFFVTEDDAEASDESEQEVARTFDDIELSPLGVSLAQAYERQIGRLAAVADVATPQRRMRVATLSKWGEYGGLCELADPAAPDRDLLRQIFLGHGANVESSHFVRNRSLLLIMELARQLSAAGWILDEPAFGAAAYCGRIVADEEDCLEIRWPRPLIDIATRWRMFYFHHYVSVALEGLFSWLVTQVGAAGIAGASIKDLSDSLNSSAVRRAVRESLGVNLAQSFGRSSPIDLLRLQVEGLEKLDKAASARLDQYLLPPATLAEEHLEGIIRTKGFAHSAGGLAMSLMLLGTTLARYMQWEGTKHGNWLASASSDPYVDIVPPVLSAGLSQRFGPWWECRWVDLAQFVLSRYVVQQHQSMSYEKSAKADRCLLQVDGTQVLARQNEVYEKIGMGNGRFRSACQVLIDLGLLAERPDRVTVVTRDGARLLREELARSA